MQLFESLQSISDPRKKRGIRHPFQSVLKLVLLGFTCRLVAIEHMVSFFEPIWDQIRGPLGFRRRKPPDPYHHPTDDQWSEARAAPESF